MHTHTYYFRMKLKRSRRLLVIVTLLAGLLLTYEVYLTMQENPLASQEQRVYYTRDLSSLPNSRNLRKLLEDRDIQELPVQISTDCSVEQIHQSLIGSDDILCINESQLWSDVTQHGVKINQLSDLQAKTAIVRAVLEVLESRKARVREQVSRQFAEQVNFIRHNKAMHSTHTDAQPDSVRIRSHEVVKVERIPSFHESMVASFVKESKNRPSDFAIPRLDSYYESHLPRKKPSQEDDDGDDFDVFFPNDMKPRKPVKRPFVPLVVDSNQLNDFNGDWGNPFNNKWKRSGVPGIPPMPGRPPDVPHIESGDNLLQRLPDGPKIQAIPPGIPSTQPGVPKIPLNYPSTIPKMPDRPPSPQTIPTKDKPAHRSSAVSLSEDLFQLKGYKFRENFDLIIRKLPTRFKYDGIRIKDKLRYIERAVNATDVVLRDVAAVSLNPDILERAKV